MERCDYMDVTPVARTMRALLVAGGVLAAASLFLPAVRAQARPDEVILRTIEYSIWRGNPGEFPQQGGDTWNASICFKPAKEVVLPVGQTTKVEVKSGVEVKTTLRAELVIRSTATPQGPEPFEHEVEMRFVEQTGDALPVVTSHPGTVVLEDQPGLTRVGHDRGKNLQHAFEIREVPQPPRRPVRRL